jgi:high-affinity nickel-transport protein
MCLLDTTDGALMMTLYTSTSLARDTVAILYYSIVLSAITVVVAICIGTIQLLSLIASFSHGKFWDGVDAVGENFDIIGGAICGAFVVFGALSVLCFRPWRRWAERGRRTLVSVVSVEDAPDLDTNKSIPTKISPREEEIMDA